MSGYPDNVCVHGNGFVQVDLGGNPGTRVHIWHEALPDCQHVNTATHNHRFGFVSTVLRGVVAQQQLRARRDDAEGTWTLWKAEGERLPTGNRPLVKQPGLYELQDRGLFNVHAGSIYTMRPRDWHTTTPVTKVAVTLMTKTIVLDESEFTAAVLCEGGKEPDQEFDRRQVPFRELEAIIKDALKNTPFEGVRLW